jgi:hypothetical protein
LFAAWHVCARRRNDSTVDERRRIKHCRFLSPDCWLGLYDVSEQSQLLYFFESPKTSESCTFNRFITFSRRPNVMLC